MLAQAIGEYGAGALSDGISSGILDVFDTVTSLSPLQYGLGVAIAVIIWLVFSARN